MSRLAFLVLLAGLSTLIVGCGDDDTNSDTPDSGSGEDDVGSGDGDTGSSDSGADDTSPTDTAAADTAEDVQIDSPSDTATDVASDTLLDAVDDASDGSGDGSGDVWDGPANCLGFDWCLTGQFEVTDDQEDLGGYENTDAFDTVIGESVYFSVGFNTSLELQGSPPDQGRSMTYQFAEYSFAFGAASSEIWNAEFYSRVNAGAPTITPYNGLSSSRGVVLPVFSGRADGYRYSIAFWTGSAPEWTQDVNGYPVLGPFEPTDTTVEIRRTVIEEGGEETTLDAGYGTASVGLIAGPGSAE